MRRYVVARFTDGHVVVVGPAGWAPRPGEKVARRAVDTGAKVDREVRREFFFDVSRILGAKRTFQKPIDPVELLQAIRDLAPD